jgi:hypothetical protein
VLVWWGGGDPTKIEWERGKGVWLPRQNMAWPDTSNAKRKWTRALLKWAMWRCYDDGLAQVDKENFI